MTLAIPDIESHLVGWARFHHDANPSAPFGDGWRDVVASWADKVPGPILKKLRGIYTCARFALLSGTTQQIHDTKVIQAIQSAQHTKSCSADDGTVYVIRRKHTN